MPKRTLSIIRLWMKRLRRCLRAAARGAVKLARRIRPADLWLDAEQHTMPAARGLVVDLRPIAAGGDAVVMAPSGVGGVEPITSVATDQLGVDDAGFLDQAIISEMRDGIADDSVCQRGTLLCAPHASALLHFTEASAKVRKSVDAGWATGGWELPCWPLRASPYGIVDESERAGVPKHRLTNDLSWPKPDSMPDGKGGFVESVNGAMLRDDWPYNRLMRVHEVAEAAAVLESSGAPVELWGIDGQSYYRIFGRQRAELWRNALVALDGFQLDERCCFGSAADASKCSRGSNYLAWQTLRALREVDAQYPSRDAGVLAWQQRRRAAGLAAGASPAVLDERWTALHSFGYYIDDGAGASVADLLYSADGAPLLREGVQLRRSTLHFEAAIGVLERFGFSSNPSKEQPPSRKIETLGVEIDLDMQRMRVTDQKRAKYSARAAAVAEMRSCPREQMVALLSRLQFAASCFPIGRQWLHAPWRAVRAQWRLANGDVLITKAVRAALQRWAAELRCERHAGVPLACRHVKRVGEPGGGAIYADASGSGGFTAWTVSDGELLYVEDVWSADEQPLLICEKELLASTFGLVALAPAAGFDSVISYTDNTVAQAAMRSSAAKTPLMQLIVERRSSWLVDSGRVEAAARITSKANLWADLGSRGRLIDVLRQAAAAGLAPRRVGVSAEWRALGESDVSLTPAADA